MSTSLELDILEELSYIPTLDAHEHLDPEEHLLNLPRDFFALFRHYSAGDLISAGATKDDLALIRNKELPLETRWNRFFPFYKKIKYGGYATSARIVIRDILGFDELNDDTYQPISEKLQAETKP